MPHSEHFVVSTKDKKIRRATTNSRDYFSGEKEPIDLYIEVFGYQHQLEAQKIYEALKNAGLSKHYFKIKIETR